MDGGWGNGKMFVKRVHTTCSYKINKFLGSDVHRHTQKKEKEKQRKTSKIAILDKLGLLTRLCSLGCVSIEPSHPNRTDQATIHRTDWEKQCQILGRKSLGFQLRDSIFPVECIYWILL